MSPLGSKQMCELSHEEMVSSLIEYDPIMKHQNRSVVLNYVKKKVKILDIQEVTTSFWEGFHIKQGSSFGKIMEK